MADLRDRFAELDRVPVPPLWEEALRRAAELDATPIERPRIARRDRQRQTAWQGYRLWRAPSFAWAVLVLLLALAVTVSVGTWLRSENNPIVVAPTSSPTLTGSPPTSLPPSQVLGDCPGATQADEIRDLEPDGATDVRWISTDGGPAGIPGRGLIAAVSTGSGDDSPAIALVDPGDGRACRLADLGQPAGVWGTRWSPAGDALAIELQTGTQPLAFEVLVWSPAGMSRVWTGDFLQRASWSPDGQTLALLEPNVVILLPASGAAPTEIRCSLCEPGRPIAWSPSGTMLARHATSAVDTTVMVGPASGPDLRRLELELRSVEVVTWRDDATLVAWDREGSRLILVPVAAPETFTVLAPLAATTMAQVLSPDLRYAASLDDTGRDLVVRDLETGTTTIVASAARVGPGTILADLAWAPDSVRLAFTVRGSAAYDQDHILGMWEVEPDGSGERQITTERFELVGGISDSLRLAGSWQPAAP